MTEPAGSFNFTAQMLAASATAVGNGLVFDSSLGYWVVATAAARTSANARTQAIATTAYGGSAVGKVQYQSAGILPASISLLAAGSASWVRMSSTGFIERFTPVAAGTSDVIGKCYADGRVALELGIWTEDLAIGGGGGASLSGTIPGLLHLSGANAGTADPNFTVPSAGVMAIGWDAGVPNKGFFEIYAATGGTETPATATFPADGLYRLSYFTADGPFHGDSITLVGVRVSTDNTAGGAGAFDISAFGVSGGNPFVGDPGHVTQTNVFGDGIFIDAGPGGGGAGAHPLADFTGEVQVNCKATTTAGGFTTTYFGLIGSGAPPVGVASFSGGGPSRLRSSIGTANQVLAVNAGATDLVWVTPSSGPSLPLSTANGGLGANNGGSTGIPVFSSGTVTFAAKVNPGGASVAMGALAIDWSLGNVFTKTLANSGNTITFSNVASGETITVRLTGGGAGCTVTWPAVKWPGGAVPVQTTSGTDVYTFFRDGANTYGSYTQAHA
jgi:hypothetical protein